MAERIRWRVIQAWADALDGTGYTLTPSYSKKYTAWLETGKAADWVPVVADFSGKWVRQVPVAISASKSGSVTTITLENYDSEEEPTVITINDPTGWDATLETWDTNFRFNRNKLVEFNIDAPVTLTTAPDPQSNVRIFWRFTYNGAHAITVPTDWKRTGGSASLGALTLGRTYCMEVVALVFSWGTRFRYEVTEI